MEIEYRNKTLQRSLTSRNLLMAVGFCVSTQPTGRQGYRAEGSKSKIKNLRTPIAIEASWSSWSWKTLRRETESPDCTEHRSANLTHLLQLVFLLLFDLESTTETIHSFLVLIEIRKEATPAVPGVTLFGVDVDRPSVGDRGFFPSA